MRLTRRPFARQSPGPTCALYQPRPPNSKVAWCSIAPAIQECAELFSLSSSLSSGRKHFWFSNLRNRDGISTRRLNVGVFTRPRPEAEVVDEEFYASPTDARCSASM